MTKTFALLLLCSSFSGCEALPAAPPGSTAQVPQQQPPAQTGQNAPSGTWTGTLTYTWSETVNSSSGGVTSTASQSYEAKVNVSSQAVDTDRWTLAGEATILAERKIFFKQTIVSSLGSCTEEHRDDAKANGNGQIEGGLEISDDFYQLTVRLPVVAGSEESVRINSGACGSSTTTDVHPWPTSPISTGGSGSLPNPNRVSGSSPGPSGGTVTWSLTRQP